MLPVCNFSHLDLEIYCSSWSLESDGHIFVMSEREYSSIHFAAPLRRICATWQQKASSTFEAALAAKVLYFRFHRFFGGAELERRMGEKRQTIEAFRVFSQSSRRYLCNLQCAQYNTNCCIHISRIPSGKV